MPEKQQPPQPRAPKPPRTPPPFDLHDHAIRQVMDRWQPDRRAKAHHMLEECLARAVSLTTVLIEYVWAQDTIRGGDLRPSLELLQDLVEEGYSMLEHLADEDETPGEEGQR